jgi:hypothetical protein
VVGVYTVAASQLLAKTEIFAPPTKSQQSPSKVHWTLELGYGKRLSMEDIE